MRPFYPPSVRPPSGALLTVIVAVLLASATVAAASSHAKASDAGDAEASVVPELPFDDNPDPDQCGIPQPLGDAVRGVVSGMWEGELLFEDVHLYDSHLRAEVTGTVPSGSAVEVVMYQNNPVLDYWFVRWEGPDGVVEGWLPDPFLDRGESG